MVLSYREESNKQTAEAYSVDYYNRLSMKERSFEMEEGYKLCLDNEYYEDMLHADLDEHKHGGPEFTQEFKDRMQGMMCYARQQTDVADESWDMAKTVEKATGVDINEFGYKDKQEQVNAQVEEKYGAYAKNKYAPMEDVLGHDVVDHEKFIESFNPTEEEMQNVDISGETINGQSLDEALAGIEASMEKQRARRERREKQKTQDSPDL